jgi:hypothetical protein
MTQHYADRDAIESDKRTGFYVPTHRRTLTYTEGQRVHQKDPSSRAADFYQGAGDRMPGKHQAGRHAIPAEHMAGEPEFRTTPINVCWGQHCLGREWAARHRHTYNPVHH